MKHFKNKLNNVLHHKASKRTFNTIFCTQNSLKSLNLGLKSILNTRKL